MYLSQENFILLILVFIIITLFLIVLFSAVLIRNAKIRNEKEIQLRDTMLSTQEHERNRIAEDLHDEIGPQLSAIKLKLQTLESESKNHPSESIQAIKQLLNHAIESIRATARNLSSLMLGKVGLVEAIRETILLFGENHQVTIKFNENYVSATMPEHHEVGLYRIVTELINNSYKHSNCNLITINLTSFESTLVLEYTDNGSRDDDLSIGMGVGLANIRNRINYMSGIIEAFPVDFKAGAHYKFRFSV